MRATPRARPPRAGPADDSSPPPLLLSCWLLAAGLIEADHYLASKDPRSLPSTAGPVLAGRVLERSSEASRRSGWLGWSCDVMASTSSAGDVAQCAACRPARSS